MTDRQKHTLLFSFVGVAFLTVSLFGVLYTDTRQKHFQISFLDVGQGDAIFIETVEGVQVLIDGGPKNAVIPKLKEVMPRGDTSLDMIVITNPDSDHLSGFSQVIDDYTVGSVLVAGTRSTTTTYTDLMNKIKSKHIKQLAAYRDVQFVLGKSALLTILFPDQIVRSWDRNNGSIVARLTYKDTAVMLMGDASVETEKLILSTTQHQELVSQILKLGHHGSKTSSSEEWIDAVAPQIAIVSAGAGNRYGHPHQEIIDRLNDREIEIKETSKDGTITYYSDGVEWQEKK